MVTADLERLPGLQARSWSRVGAQLGLAATGAMGGLLFVAGALSGGVLCGLLTAGTAVIPAAIIGAAFGGRWQRWLLEDGGTASVAQWLRRLTVDGAAAGAGTSAAFTGGLGVLHGHGNLTEFALGTTLMAGLGAAGGAVLLGTVGLPYILAVTRNRPAWPVLAGTAVLGPTLIFGLINVAFP